MKFRKITYLSVDVETNFSPFLGLFFYYFFLLFTFPRGTKLFTFEVNKKLGRNFSCPTLNKLFFFAFGLELFFELIFLESAFDVQNTNLFCLQFFLFDLKKSKNITRGFIDKDCENKLFQFVIVLSLYCKSSTKFY